MKSNPWILCGMAWLAAAAVMAQTSRTPPPAAGATAKDVLLDPPGAATVKEESLNVRGQPAFTSEVITHLHQGQSVAVFEQITLAKPRAGEPTNWSKVALPTNAPVWIFAEYVDTNSMTVTARRVNVRGGPGENYSVVARLDKGAPVKEVRTAQGWIQIEPPTNAYGYVASEFLKMEVPTAPPPATPVVAEPVAATPVITEPLPTTPTNPPTATNSVAEATNATPPATNTAVANTPIIAPEPVAPTPTETKPATPTPAVTPPATVTPPEIATPETKDRVVTREGYVRKALNIQAPADFELHDIQTGELTEYLQPSKEMVFKLYVGARVSVTGPEILDRRWPKTPVLQVQTVDLMP